MSSFSNSPFVPAPSNSNSPFVPAPSNSNGVFGQVTSNNYVPASTASPPAIQKASESLKCDETGFRFDDPAWRTWIFMSLGTVLIFVLLSPGLIVSLPTNGNKVCSDRIPLPGGATGSCNDGTYLIGPSDPITPTEANIICQQRNSCNGLIANGYTNFLTAIFHAIVFVIFVNIFSSFVLSRNS